MFRIRSFPKLLLSISTIGLIISIFSVFFRDKWLFGALCLLVSSAIYAAYLLSYDYKASHLMQLAKKHLDRNEVDKAVDCMLVSARLNANEENLVRIFGQQRKNLDTFRAASAKLYEKMDAGDTPFVRFLIGSFFYFAGDIQKTRELLTAIPVGERSIKTVRLLGSVLYDMKDYDGAIEVLSRYDSSSLPTNENELAVVFGLGIAYLSKGDKDKASQYLQRVQTRSPKFGNVSQILAAMKDKAD
ncbi:MAG: tetratricopeptide repeat protein [Caldiserica bacterium]|nr:tetratricopeptide repeat protein [Caldisericota bacterium]